MSFLSDTSFLYTPFSEAVEELERRRSNKELISKIDRYFEKLPSPVEMSGQTRMVIAPPIVTPNLELEYVLDIARHSSIQPLFFEYGNDKFVHLNFEKRYLGEMVFCKKPFLRKRVVTGSIRIIDFEKDQGKRFNEIKTLSGENLIDFHHRLVKERFPDFDLQIRDFSDWFERSRLFDPQFPYARYLGLFLHDGILLTNFVTEKYQSDFTRSLVVPAFKQLREQFGISPLIVPIEPIETDHDHFWCYYEEDIKELV